jgi:hypothetical protein
MPWLQVVDLRAQVGRSDVPVPMVGGHIEIPEEGIGFGRTVAPHNTGWEVPWVQLAARQVNLGVGRHQAKICLEDGAWWLTHSASKYPLFLNGRLVGRARLDDGDVIALGFDGAAATFRFRTQRPAEPF